MEKAYCIPDDTSYTAEFFSTLPARKIAVKRHQLKCTECGGNAYFTKAVAGRRAAYFGSKEHREDCTASRGDTQVAYTENEEIMIAKRIVITFGVKTVLADATEEYGGKLSKPRATIELAGPGKASNNVVKRDVNGLLHALLSLPNFQHSSTLISIDGEEIPASDFFVPLSEVTSDQGEHTRGFWGRIYNGAYGNGGWLWLNRDDATACSIGLRSEVIAQAQERFGFASPNELANAYVLVIGKFKWQKCKVDNVGHISIQPRQPSAPTATVV